MWWIMAAVVLGGMAVALQAPINAALSRELGGPVAAAAVSFGVGFVVLLVIVLVQGQGGAFLKLTQVPAWTLVGGGGLLLALSQWVSRLTPSGTRLPIFVLFLVGGVALLLGVQTVSYTHLTLPTIYSV